MDFINKNKQSGFTLVEIAIVMLVSGFIVFAMVNAYLKWNDILRSSTTKEHLSIVNDAMSAYVSRNFRVPCPADPAGAGPEPFGMERSSGANGTLPPTVNGCSNIAAGETEGIVPFKTLGIDATVSRDGWGNLITYQVSPVFTQDMYGAPAPFPPAAVPVPNPPRIHAKCRTTEWIEGVSRVSGLLEGGRNTALQKARFCCIEPAGAGIETQVFSTAAPAINSPSLVFVADGANWYNYANFVADPNDPADPVSGGVAQPFYRNNVYGGGGAAGNFGHTDMIVYALISHGKNGEGAYIGNGTNARSPLGVGLSEIANANATNQNVYDVPHNNSNNNTYYDDIVSWQTQSDLMARLRRDSCAAP